MNTQRYDQTTFLCAECGWAGPGHDCKPVDCLKSMAIIACPDCETRIGVVPYQNQNRTPETTMNYVNWYWVELRRAA